MRFGIHTLDDFDFMGKTVLVRVDINQPIDRKNNTLKSINRIKACLPTISELSDKQAKVVLLAHQGSDIEYQNFCSITPHAKVLSELLKRPVRFIDDVCGPAARECICTLQNGEILLLDNVRYLSEEQTLFETKLCLTHEQQADTLLIRLLAPLADYYVCDAFAAAHRNQPSLCGFEQRLPSAMGRLFEKEYCMVTQLLDQPRRPCVYVLGGAKVGDAFAIMDTVLAQKKADFVITGGVVANILLAAAGYAIGSGSEEYIKRQHYWEYVERIRPVYLRYKEQILLPADVAWQQNGERLEAAIGCLPDDISIVDIGHKTAEIYSRIIKKARTIFANGPMGVFEKKTSEFGTDCVWKAVVDSEGFTLIGGGDSIAAAEKLGIVDQISYVSTGGGALIRFLTGEELPVIRALRHSVELEKGEV
ncbi:phosphoglycerate kinase [Diplocloster agilis]|uniref:phosphoglycerate kinase n=1 Tax=Diplocloster agilis TaxID=2850323 RepID=UPI0008221C13|nr:phosphoglycerate kinase [Suonthocola fibrivorans]MCU6734747.1 phosphoglycerate kinase [Suonthocola fibrivorans]SCJ52763.1 Phosphoglycerate kinase [uncultured Clostridium sp.]